MSDLTMRILLTAQDGASPVVQGLSNNLRGLGIPGGILAGVVLGVAAVGTTMAISAKEAADFQQGITRLKTGAGDLTDNMTTLGNGILDVSVKTGVLANGTQGLNAAMYLIISSGQRGAMALNTLSVAAKAAQIEQANVVDVANTLSGVMTNYGTTTHTATQYMNGLIEAVKHGKITLQELSVAMGPIDPIAKNLGIHMQDVAAAMTTQTNAMVPAARAATGLRFMMMALENPTKKQTTAMVDMGLSTVAVANEMKISLPGALQMIYEAAKKAGPEGSVPFDRALSDMVGGMRSFTAFTSLTGSHMKDFVANTKLIGDAMNKSVKDVQGWNDAQQNLNIQLDRAGAVVNVLMIKLGTALLPVLTQVFEGVTSNLSAFGDWIDKSNILSNVAQTLSGWIGYVGDAFQQVFMWGNNLTDSFSRASSIIDGTFNPIVKTLADSFDRAKGFISSTTQAAKPMLDTFDRASGIIQSTSTAVKGANNVWIPFWQTVKNLRDQFMAINWGAVGAGIERIRVAISQIDWGKFGKAFNDVAAAIGKIDWGNVAKNFEKMVTALAKVDWGTIGTDISTIAKSLSKVDWGALAKGMSTAIQGITDVVKAFQKAHDILLGHSIVPDIINGIVKWFASLPGRLGGIFTGLIANIVTWFTTIGTNMKTGATKAWTNVSTVFSSAWSTYISKPLATIATNIGTWASTLAASAKTWGVNMIQSFIDGINSMVGAVGKAASNIASQVAKFLGFHSPAAEGPGRYITVYGENMMKAFMQGMANVEPQLHASLSMMMAPVGGSGGAGGHTTVINQHFDVTVNAPALSHREGEVLVDAVAKGLAHKYRRGSSHASTGVY